MRLNRLNLISLMMGAGVFAAAGWVAGAAIPSASVSWKAPIQNADGTALSPGDIKSYLVEWRRTVGGSVVGSQVVVAPALTLSVPLSCGSYVFDVIATAQAAGNDPANSAPSATANYATGVTCTPNPPTGLTVSKAS